MGTAPVILYRRCNHPDDDQRELEAAAAHFPVCRLRGEIPAGRVVIGRYAVLPHYAELEADLRLKNCELINTHAQHRWIADFEWYHDLREFTPQSWWREDFPHCQLAGPFVVKGSTNSFKWQWKTRMFAKDRAGAVTLAAEVEALLPGQRAVIREYVPLRVLEPAVVGPPFTNEWRCFFVGTQMIAHGYYWSSAEPETIAAASFPTAARDLVQRAAAIAAEHCTFFVLDVAETEDGRWIVVEVNDGQCSGLSEIPPDDFYGHLAAATGAAKP